MFQQQNVSDIRTRTVDSTFKELNSICTHQDSTLFWLDLNTLLLQNAGIGEHRLLIVAVHCTMSDLIECAHGFCRIEYIQDHFTGWITAIRPTSSSSSAHPEPLVNIIRRFHDRFIHILVSLLCCSSCCTSGTHFCSFAYYLQSEPLPLSNEQKDKQVVDQRVGDAHNRVTCTATWLENRNRLRTRRARSRTFLLFTIFSHERLVHAKERRKSYNFL